MDGNIDIPVAPRREYTIQQRVDRVEGFDMLRGFAAIMVVISHIVAVTYTPFLGDQTTSPLKQVGWSFGAIGVDLFLVLSGFVVARAYQRQTQAGLNYFDFIRGRMIRLAPIYLFSLLIAVTVWILLQNVSPPIHSGAALQMAHQKIDVYTIAANIFPVWANPGQNILNPPWWTITVEILGIMVMPILVLIALHRGIKGPYALGALLFIILLPGAFGIGPTTRHLICLAPIALGVVLGLNLVKTDTMKTIPMVIIGILILAMTAIIRPMFDNIDYGFRLIAMNGSALVLIAFARVKNTSFFTRAMGKLGGASYAIYAIHYPIIIFAVHYGPAKASPNEITTIAAAAATLAILLSFPLTIYIDRSAIRLSQAYTKGKAKAEEQKLNPCVKPYMIS